MRVMASQIISVSIVYLLFVKAQIKENIKAQRHLCEGNSPVTSYVEMFPFDDVIMKWKSVPFDCAIISLAMSSSIGQSISLLDKNRYMVIPECPDRLCVKTEVWGRVIYCLVMW